MTLNEAPRGNLKANNFRKPRTERPLLVEFRNGWKAGPYKAGQLIWSDRGWESDVVAVAFADTTQKSNDVPTWTPTSGGY